MAVHHHPVRVYYEDTDFTGVVYHANYLKFMERAREHLIGPEALVRLHEEDGVGFVVYRAELGFKEGAVHGDKLDIRTRVMKESAWRLVFHQDVWREGGATALVEGKVELVCVDRNQKLVQIPMDVIAELARFTAGD